jgi:hypothetical protein
MLKHNSPLPLPRRSSNEMPWGLSAIGGFIAAIDPETICVTLGPKILNIF